MPPTGATEARLPLSTAWPAQTWHPAVFSINILDTTGGTGTNQYADLDNLTSDWFLAEIGISNLAGAETHYQARLVGNGGLGWINLDQFDGPTRSVGWHNFLMIFKGPPPGEDVGHEVDVYVDGLLAAKNLTLGDDTVLREPRIGARSLGRRQRRLL